jgi:hypothetical protein
MNIQKIVLIIVTIISFQSVFSQKDGYWDKTRATTEEITVSARDRIIIKTQDFPEGTTEVVYRITLLDKNQQMAGSLVSVLKAIPDPTGISQGSAGAVFILSKISGDDKCKYAVFSSAELATKYKENGKTEDACWCKIRQSARMPSDFLLINRLVCNLILEIYGLVLKVKTGS